MQVLLPTLEGIPRRPGVPALNANKLRPVYPIRAEQGSFEHFLFGGGPESLTGLKGVASFLPTGNVPAFAEAFLATPDGVLNGLASTIAEPAVFTCCMAVRYLPQDGKGTIYMGTLQAGNGDGKGFGIIRGGASDTLQLLARPNATGTAMASVSLAEAMGKWIFLVYQLDTNSGAWRCSVGGGSSVSGTLASAYARSDRGLAIGNAYYAPVSGTAYDRGVSVAEFIAYDKILSADEVQSIYLRSKERLVSRGIELF